MLVMISILLSHVIHSFPTKQKYLEIMLSYGKFKEICRGRTSVLMRCLIQYFLISRSHKNLIFRASVLQNPDYFCSKLNWTQGEEENLPVKIRQIWNSIRNDLLNVLWSLIS